MNRMNGLNSLVFPLLSFRWKFRSRFTNTYIFQLFDSWRANLTPPSTDKSLIESLTIINLIVEAREIGKSQIGIFFCKWKEKRQVTKKKKAIAKNKCTSGGSENLKYDWHKQHHDRHVFFSSVGDVVWKFFDCYVLRSTHEESTIFALHSGAHQKSDQKKNKKQKTKEDVSTRKRRNCLMEATIRIHYLL